MKLLAVLLAVVCWAQEPIRINCGGATSTYTSSVGEQWVTDRNFTGGDLKYTGDSIANTQDRYLYATARTGLYTDFSYSIHGVSRFRVNAFRQRGTVGIVCRVIPTTIRGLKELGLPDIVAQLCRCTRGLILVTGPTGSGKSTTLAAMIDLINSERPEHILTLEDPIEYLHKHKKSIVNQREMGVDSHSYATALRAALREDPNVILVGEMRDLETTQIALTAAETGHLVLSTLHTQDAAQTIDRVIDIFPPHQQEQVKTQLSGTLQGIIAQLLLSRADVPGRVAAFEILVATSAIRNLIREGKTHQIPSAIQTGARYGMKSMESSLRELYQQGKISLEDFQVRVPAAAAQLGGGAVASSSPYGV